VTASQSSIAPEETFAGILTFDTARVAKEQQPPADYDFDLTIYLPHEAPSRTLIQVCLQALLATDRVGSVLSTRTDWHPPFLHKQREQSKKGW